jgi:hypothetical protein
MHIVIPSASMRGSPEGVERGESSPIEFRDAGRRQYQTVMARRLVELMMLAKPLRVARNSLTIPLRADPFTFVSNAFLSGRQNADHSDTRPAVGDRLAGMLNTMVEMLDLPS